MSKTFVMDSQGQLQLPKQALQVEGVCAQHPPVRRTKPSIFFKWNKFAFREEKK
jgi:hypothetical protein